MRQDDWSRPRSCSNGSQVKQHLALITTHSDPLDTSTYSRVSLPGTHLRLSLYLYDPSVYFYCLVHILDGVYCVVSDVWR